MSQLKLSNISPPPSPAAGQVTLYANGNSLYSKDSSGTVTGPFGAGGGGAPSGPAGGDLGGTYPNPEVQALRGFGLASTAPALNQVLTWSGTNWSPAVLPPGVTASNILYVQAPANGGNDATGARGDSTKPYATIAAAINDATDEDIILVGAGVFSGPGNLNGINPLLANITIIGQGQKNTLIQSTGSEVFAIDYATNNVVWQKFVLAQCGLIGNGLSTIFLADGTGAPPATFFPGSASTGAGLFDVEVSQTVNNPNDIAILACGSVRMERVYQRNDAQSVGLVINNVAEAIVQDCAVTVIRDGVNFSSPSGPPVSSPGSSYERCRVSDVYLSAQSRTTWNNCIVETGMVDDKFSVGGVPLVGPIVRFQGGTIVNLNLGASSAIKIPDDPAAQMLFDFRNAVIYDVLAEVKAPAANRQTVSLVGCTILNTATANDGIHMDAKTSMFKRPAAFAFSTSPPSPTAGTITPPFFDLPSVATVALGAVTLPFGFNLPFPAPPYTVSLESDNVLDGALAVTLKTNTDIQVTAATGGSGNVSGMVYIK